MKWQAMHRRCTYHNVLGIDLITTSTEGRVEHQKLNQTPRRRKASFGWVYGVQFDVLEKKWSD